MSTTESVPLDIHMPFSYWRKRDFDLNTTAVYPNAQLVEQYRHALVAEIESLGSDMADEEKPTIESVFFSGGYLGLFHPDSLLELLHAIHKVFPTKKPLSIGGVLFPGSVDMYAASTYRNIGFDALLFEVPTFSVRECSEHNLPNTMQALDKSVHVIQAYGINGFGLRLPKSMPKRGGKGWEYVMGQINHYQPLYIELVGQPEESTSSKTTGHTMQSPLEPLLERGGYRELAPSIYTRAQKLPDCLCLHGQAGQKAARIGIGCGATTILDGYRTHTTANFSDYLAGMGSNDYRNVIDYVDTVGQ